MTLFALLRHRLRAVWRVPFVERRIGSLLIGAFVALYLGGGLAGLGLAFDDLVRDAAPGADPLLVVAQGLLPFGIVYAAVRVVAESGLGANPQPYRPLPIRRDALVAFLAVGSLFGLWNVVPLAFLVTVSVEAALSGAVWPALRLGLAGLGVLGAVTYTVPMGRRALSDRPFVAAGLVLVAAGSVAIEAVDLAGGLASLLDASGWLLGGVVRGRVLPGAVSLALLGAVGFGYARWLQGAMALDEGASDARRSDTSGDWLDRLARRGPAWREAVLEYRLVLRNSTTRTILFSCLITPTVFVVTGLLTEKFDPLSELYAYDVVVVGITGSALFTITYGVNLFSWEGQFLEATMSRPVSVPQRIAGKIIFLGSATTVWFLIPVPFLVDSSFLAGNSLNLFFINFMFYLYNVGVTIPALVAGATFNRSSVEPKKSLANGVNFSGVRSLFIFSTFLIPTLFVVFVRSSLIGFSLIGGLGLLSALAYPLWLRGLVALYRRNQYAMMRGFRSSRG